MENEESFDMNFVAGEKWPAEIPIGSCNIHWKAHAIRRSKSFHEKRLNMQPASCYHRVNLLLHALSVSGSFLCKSFLVYTCCAMHKVSAKSWKHSDDPLHHTLHLVLRAQLRS